MTTPRLGQILDGKYRIEKLLGSGSMGDVYYARIGPQPFAIKILHTHLANNPEYLRRFRREAQAAQRFSHPNSIRVYEQQISSDGLVYMVMDYIEGRTLRAELTARRRLPPREAVAIIEPVLDALATAHKMGVVHRDLKPENIMLGRVNGARIVKVLDLGLAKVQRTKDSDMVAVSSISAAGELLGTPNYMSPEQWDGDKDIDGRSDIYNLGVILYELISGRTPFVGERMFDLLQHHLFTPPPPVKLAVPPTPAALSAAIQRAMAKNRDERPANCEQFAAELRAALPAEEEDALSDDDTLQLSSVQPSTERVNETIMQGAPLPKNETLRSVTPQSLASSISRWSGVARYYPVIFAVCAGIGLVTSILTSSPITLLAFVGVIIIYFLEKR